MQTIQRLQKLEKEIAILWGVIEDERLWHPSVVREIQRRSRTAKRIHIRGNLKKAEEIFAYSK